MATRPESWPEVRNELLPHALFRLAEQYPDLIYSEYFTPTPDPADGYHKVTYRQFADAVHSMAWWLEENVGKPTTADGSETIIYFGASDLRYGILVLACVMVGYKMLGPGPRYAVDAIIRLIGSVNGKVLLRSSQAPPVAQEVLQKHTMKNFEVPSLDDLLTSAPTPYPFTKTFEKNKHEPFMALHTSGSTGFPKPVIWTHEWAASYSETHYLPHKNEEQWLCGPNRRVVFPMPPFHASGILCQLLIPICTGTLNIYPPLSPMPNVTVENMLRVAEWVVRRDGKKLNVLPTAPPFAEYLASNPEMLDRARNVADRLIWSGGGISIEAGRILSEKMIAGSVMGSTELGMWPVFLPIEIPETEKAKVMDDWNYMQLHPKLNIRLNPEFESEEGLVGEAIMSRNQDGDWIQPPFYIFPDSRDYKMGDLFIQHVGNPNRWKHYGRSDDLLVFITAEKYHPATAEAKIIAHPSVDDALIVGTKRPRAALVLKLKEGVKVDDLWGVVEEVNKMAPVPARITKEMVLVVDEPFPRSASKGSVMKGVVLEKYQDQLDELYKKSGPLVEIF